MSKDEKKHNAAPEAPPAPSPPAATTPARAPRVRKEKGPESFAQMVQKQIKLWEKYDAPTKRKMLEALRVFYFGNDDPKPNGAAPEATA